MSSTLRDRLEKVQGMGGEARLAAHRAAGKLTARERLARLFDQGAFTELDALVRHRATGFGMTDREVAADGVIAGFGAVEGRTVHAFAQDATSMSGSLGEMHARKLCKVLDLALQAGTPLVGLNDSGGARIQEGVDALAGYGEVFYRNSIASGVIPQLSAILGTCAGGAVYSPALTDFVFMTRGASHMFVTGPKVIKSVTGEDVTLEQLGGADVHATLSGVSHFTCESDHEAIDSIRTLLGFLPSNNLDDAPFKPGRDAVDQPDAELDSLVPKDPRAPFDMMHALVRIVDDGNLMVSQASFAPNIITAFARLGGRPLGVVANQPMHLAGCLDVNASDKASRFIRFCDAFNLPLLTVVDVPGFLPGVDQEHLGLIRHGAKMLWSYAEATVPKLTLVVRKDYGGAYLAMCSRQLGADFMAAWPSAEIAVMGAEGAVEVLFDKELRSAANPQAARDSRLQQYRETFYSPYQAAARGYIDAVIEPRDSRAVLHKALSASANKRQVRPPRRHGNIPL